MRVTKGYKGLQRVTRGSRGLQGLRKSYKECEKGLERVTGG